MSTSCRLGLVGPLLLAGAATLGAQQTDTASSHAARPHLTPAPAPLVLDGATVVDVMHGRLLPARRIVVVGSRIRAVGTARTVALPADARVVDARGTYVIPGLWDMHVHLSEAESLDHLYRVYLANGITGLRDAGSVSSLDTLRLWRQAILAGTRTGPPRQLLSGKAINEAAGGVCEAAAFERCVRDTTEARQVADSLVAAGADLLKPRDVSGPVYAAIAAEARRLGVPFGGHAQHRRSEDWHRIMMGVSHIRDGVAPLAASALGARFIDHELGGERCTVHPARKWGRFWGGPDSAGFPPEARAAWRRVMLQSGYQESPTHLAACRREARRFRRNGTWFVPTLAAGFPFRGVAADSVWARFERAAVASRGGFPPGNWLRDSTRSVSRTATSPAPPSDLGLPGPGSADSMRPGSGSPDAVLRLAARLDLPLLAGTDKENSGVLAPLHAELAMLVAEGLSPLHALQAATLNPARAFHATDSLGTVAAGKLADLVLLDADPLADITNTTAIRAVVVNGRYFDRAALDRLVAGAEAPAPGSAP